MLLVGKIISLIVSLIYSFVYIYCVGFDGVFIGLIIFLIVELAVIWSDGDFGYLDRAPYARWWPRRTGSLLPEHVGGFGMKFVAWILLFAIPFMVINFTNIY